MKIRSLDGFATCNVDADSDVKYYGYVDHEGCWYIMQETTSTGIFLYAADSSGYSTAWTGRAALSYVNFAAL